MDCDSDCCPGHGRLGEPEGFLWVGGGSLLEVVNSTQEAPLEPAGWGGNRSAWQCLSSALYGGGLTLHELAKEKGSSARGRKMELKGDSDTCAARPRIRPVLCLVTREPVLSTLLGSLLCF